MLSLVLSLCCWLADVHRVAVAVVGFVCVVCCVVVACVAVATSVVVTFVAMIVSAAV